MAEAGEAPDKGHHSLQFISSEASSQSTNWLQRLEFPMQVPSRQRNSPTPQAVSGTAPTRGRQARLSPRGPEHLAQSPLQSVLNQTPWGPGPKAQQGQGGAEAGGSEAQAWGPTHCCRGPRQSHPRSRLPRCTTACWTHSAHCCIGGKSSCSGVSLWVGARQLQRGGCL